MVARGTGNHNRIHSMVSMVNTLFVKSFLKFEWHGGNQVSFPTHGGKAIFPRQLIQTFETRQNDSVPHIIHSPVFFQSVRYAASACNQILGSCLLLVFAVSIFFSHDI